MTALALASPLLFLALLVVLQRVEEAVFPNSRPLTSERLSRPRRARRPSSPSGSRN